MPPLSAQQIDDYRRDGFLVLRGDVCFFDAYAPHRSAPNRTDAPRWVLYLTCNPVSQGDHYETYFADKRKSYPPDIERPAGQSRRYRV